MGGRMKWKVGLKGEEITKGLVSVCKFLQNSKHIQPALHILGNNKEGDKQKYFDIIADCDICRNNPQTNRNEFEPKGTAL